MGEVYRAEDLKLGREVAIKMLPADLLLDPERLRRVEREAKALAALNHPNTVTIHSIEQAAAQFLDVHGLHGKSGLRLVIHIITGDENRSDRRRPPSLHCCAACAGDQT